MKNVVAASLSKEFDELYGYDAVHRLNDMARGTLNEPKTALTSSTFGQCWTLDATGNWQGFREDDTGDGTWDLVQSRTANSVNEITAISETAGSSWVPPAYSAAGNMTTLPQPNDPTQGYTATYDAWNRLVQLEDGEETVSEYAYDGAKRRIVQKSYEAGVLDETQHLYYTDSSQWQVIEERVGESDSAERQFVWGLRYIDDLVLRDRDTDTNGTLDERVYSCQDGNWNVTALVGSMGAVQERFAYTAYGVPTVLTAGFGSRASSAFGWETLYCGYRCELLTRLYHIRHRVYQPGLGTWVQRDPVITPDGAPVLLLAYSDSTPLHVVDPHGLAPDRGRPPVMSDGEPWLVPECRVNIYAGHNVTAYELFLNDHPDHTPPPGTFIAFASCAIGGTCVQDDLESEVYAHTIGVPKAFRDLFNEDSGELPWNMGIKALGILLSSADTAAKNLCGGKVPNPYPRTCPDEYPRTDYKLVCKSVRITVKCDAAMKRLTTQGEFEYKGTVQKIRKPPRRIQNACDTNKVISCG